MKKYCIACGREVLRIYSYCPWCGSKQEGNADAVEPETLREIFELWRSEHYGNIEESSIKGYELSWKKLSVYSDYRIIDIKAEQYQKVIDDMVKSGLSRSSVEKMRVLISQLCQYAMRRDILDRNYSKFLKLPKAKKPNRDRFSDDELKILWSHSDDRTVQIILIFAYTGLRANELFHLKKANIFMSEPRPYIICGSKTEAGRNRMVILSRHIVDFVKEAYEKSNGEYLFSNQFGTPLDLHNWRARHYYPTLDKYGIQRREIHCLRHTFASMMVKAGADQKALTELMGHESIVTTADLYAHADVEQLTKAIDLLNRQS